MQRTFRPRVYYRNVSAVALLFFGCLVAFSVAAYVLDEEHVNLYRFSIAFWSAWLLLSIYMLFSYYRESLKIDDKQVRQRTVFSQRELLLDASTHIKLRIWPRGGSIVVRSPLARIPIDLENFEREERVEIIAYLRSSVAADQQTGWDLFCQRWALPLVESPDETNTVLITRRHIDRLFAWMLLANLSVTALLIWLDGWKWWPSILVLVPLWLVLRLLISPQGQRAATTNSLPGFGWWLSAFVGLLAGMLLYGWMKSAGVAVWVLAAACFVQFLRWVNAEDRNRRELHSEQVKTNDARWRAAVAMRSAT